MRKGIMLHTNSPYPRKMGEYVVKNEDIALTDPEKIKQYLIYAQVCTEYGRRARKYYLNKISERLGMQFEEVIENSHFGVDGNIFRLDSIYLREGELAVHFHKNEALILKALKDTYIPSSTILDFNENWDEQLFLEKLKDDVKLIEKVELLNEIN